ncbi:hypothetical protein Q8791_05630 [Nocardiopsis sp. CT-R113]|uniref:Transposase n=1 Tax=Nocardiopsis codii TaxID=3065942 RepID=A0ABU7K599_9ACTN|nr:hypothetical protein [Nocardiopsis sp. CT-R113]MEE2036702.1 hypothetical protein [Nocardiopsis sp. CT-R113]
MPHTTHANARLTPAGRLALARCVVDQGWPEIGYAGGGKSADRGAEPVVPVVTRRANASRRPAPPVPGRAGARSSAGGRWNRATAPSVRGGWSRRP